MTTAKLAMGDWNLPAAKVEDIATLMGGQLVVGRGIDNAIRAGARLIRTIRPRDLYGSDHHRPIILDLLVQGVEVRALYWNVWQGQSPAHVAAHLAQLIDKYQPQVVALSEAYRCRKVLGQVPGYRRFQGFIGEASNVAVLVRRDLTVAGRHRMRMRRTWVFRGNVRRPRVYQAVRLELGPGNYLSVLGIHFPPSPGVNHLAVDESIRRVVRWGRRR